MGHDNTVHKYLCAMFQDNRLPLFCQLKRGRWRRGDFMFFEEGVLGLEEDDRGSTCREGRLSFAETDVCVRDLLFYQRVVLKRCLYILYRSNHLLLHSLVRSKRVQMFDIRRENRRLGSPNSWIQRLRNLVHIPPFNWILVLS